MAVEDVVNCFRIWGTSEDFFTDLAEAIRYYFPLGYCGYDERGRL